MKWSVVIDEAFADEMAAFDAHVIVEIEARTLLLRRFGPALGRPHADTLKGSKHSNMKE